MKLSPTELTARQKNPWREFIENCMTGDNYFRSSEMNLLQRTISSLVHEHGSYRAAGRHLAVDHAYLFKLFHGKRNPSRKVLAKLGLIKVIQYQRIKP